MSSVKSIGIFPRLQPLQSITSKISHGLLLWLALFSLVLALLFAQSAEAASQEDIACGAKNLLTDLQKTNSKEYEELLAQTKVIKNSQARFWKLEKKGQKPNWLLGTIHLSDPRVTELPPETHAAYDQASTIVLESDEVLNMQKAAIQLMAKPDLMSFSGNTTLKDFLSADELKIVEKGLKGRGIPLGTVLKMKPYILTPVVALSPCEISRKTHGTPFLDMKLALDAVKSGKKVKGVETLAEQLEAMASLPMEFHVRSLVTTLRYPKYTADSMETMINLYLQDQIGLLGPVSVYFAPEKDMTNAKDMALFEEKLITIRNHNMADRGAPILAEGNVFMAVGALHLIGDEGLVELFRKQGYTVTAVK